MGITKEAMTKIVQTLDVSYGDVLTKKELLQLFEINEIEGEERMTPQQWRKAYDDQSWAFLGCMDLFKNLMREHRKMHLMALRKNFSYEIIRPNQHRDIALGHLRKQIDKGFKECKEILDSTQTRLLDGAEKLALSMAETKVSRLESMMRRQNLRERIWTSSQDDARYALEDRRAIGQTD